MRSSSSIPMQKGDFLIGQGEPREDPLQASAMKILYLLIPFFLLFLQGAEALENPGQAQTMRIMYLLFPFILLLAQGAEEYGAEELDIPSRTSPSLLTPGNIPCSPLPFPPLQFPNNETVAVETSHKCPAVVRPEAAFPL
ncbi:UNVERIFIED_CONTAM: hypothetical protein H355_010104 [Colinus virginianus]|nr:hypothetical protein H355_010104 [Colinus virginianus]